MILLLGEKKKHAKSVGGFCFFLIDLVKNEIITIICVIYVQKDF